MKSKGFTMIEVLVALMIVSVGLLGMAALITEAHKNIQETRQRATALHLANDIVARMTANAGGLASYHGSVSAQNNQPPVLCSGNNANCSPAQVAAFDLWQWSSNLIGSSSKNSGDSNIGGLIAPVACISVTNTDQVELEIAWRGKYPRSDSRTNDCGDDDADFKSPANIKNDLRRMLIIKTRINV
ncbi:type IV pilus modification protein PilV [Endozoicomonas sp. OPT23]|uniref:type IV pilus modification protein PilV n=1 Tax=Endozoicomonas sp. OPT23 TaxID=2072845 RepID=UPI00129BF830|nr:type IV pilus modification protein PilV [Endozoicomonas sp. OPT23]MRI32305.1 type IV pilus modification protein PilV [Endozoicomonas sp. OPT23]